MISYNIKFIFFSIILGIITLIYNNDCDTWYNNTKNNNMVFLTTNFRSLGELSCELTSNHIHDSNLLREYGLANEEKYTKNKYSKDDTKRKHKISKVIEKEYTVITNLNKDKKVIYDKHKDTPSNISSSSIKYLEMQRKLYNNFYAKPGTDFKNFSDKSNNKSCECENKTKSSSKCYGKYIGYLEKGCSRGAGVCAVSAAATANSGCAVGTVAALEATGISTGMAGASKLTGFAALSALTKAFSSAAKVAEGAALAASQPYAIGALVLILIAVVLIILYIWLCRKR
ncbi:PIR protein,putative [Plasmodium sp. gorilla clade G3]|nr:PIR protein,putative [Plasmodium sp. gorilla clade G3]